MISREGEVGLKCNWYGRRIAYVDFSYERVGDMELNL